MQLKQLFTDDEAVSPVIGVILMVAITVILAAVIGTFVLGLGGDQTSTPTTKFDFSWNESGNNDLSISISGGTTIDSDNAGIPSGCSNAALKITGNGTDQCWSSLPLSAGDRFKLNDPTSGGTVEIIWVAPGGGTTQKLDTFDVPSY